jgi:hypothetical protein
VVDAARAAVNIRCRLRFTDEQLRGYAKRGIECPHHRERKGTFTREHFGNPVLAAKHRCEVLLTQSLLFHAEADSGDRIGTLKFETLFFVVFNEFGEQFQPVTIGRSGSRIVGREAIYLGKVGTVMFFGLDNFRFHDHCLTHALRIFSVCNRKLTFAGRS